MISSDRLGFGTCKQITEKIAEDAAAGIAVGRISIGSYIVVVGVGCCGLGRNRGNNDDIAAVVVAAVAGIAAMTAVVAGVASAIAISLIVEAYGEAEEAEDLVQIRNKSLDNSVQEADDGGGILFCFDVVVIVGDVVDSYVIVNDNNCGGLTSGGSTGGGYGSRLGFVATNDAGSGSGHADSTKYEQDRKKQCDNFLHFKSLLWTHYKTNKSDCQG